MDKSRVMMAMEGKVGHLRVEGRGTFEIAGAFKTAYQQLIGRGAHDVIVDFSGCEMLDSTFLGTMIGLGLRVKTLGGKVHLADANPDISATLRETGLDRLFEFR